MWEWIKGHKLTVVLGVVVCVFVGRWVISQGSGNYSEIVSYRGGLGQAADSGLAQKMAVGSAVLPPNEVAPVAGADRLIVRESTQSLLVKQVKESADKMVEFAKGKGGYMVSQTLSQPEEAPYAEVGVRVPAEKLRETLDYFASLSVKVTNEYVSGFDVTDEYVDIQARVTTLEKTKGKFEQILDEAKEVQDILQVQRELVSIQDQIDSLKGRENYLTKTAELSKITVYLSTDELALPYTPTETFRPEVIFKLAVRSVVSTLRGVASAAIWIGVFGVIWVPALGIIILIKRRMKKQEAGVKN